MAPSFTVRTVDPRRLPDYNTWYRRTGTTISFPRTNKPSRTGTRTSVGRFGRRPTVASKQISDPRVTLASDFINLLVSGWLHALSVHRVESAFELCVSR